MRWPDSKGRNSFLPVGSDNKQQWLEHPPPGQYTGCCLLVTPWNPESWPPNSLVWGFWSPALLFLGGAAYGGKCGPLFKMCISQIPSFRKHNPRDTFFSLNCTLIKSWLLEYNNMPLIFLFLIPYSCFLFLPCGPDIVNMPQIYFYELHNFSTSSDKGHMHLGGTGNGFWCLGIVHQMEKGDISVWRDIFNVLFIVHQLLPHFHLWGTVWFI